MPVKTVEREPETQAKPLPGENPASAHPDRHHNKPPLEEIIPIEFRDGILNERPNFFTLLDGYLGVGDPNSEDYKSGAVDRAVATNDEELGKCGEVVKALRAAEQLVDAVHKAVKEPYLKGGRLVDAEKNVLIARIAAGRAKVDRVMQDYADEQLKKRRDEEAARAEQQRKLEELARENNLEAALPPPPEPERVAPIRSDGGATVSLGVEHIAVIEDITKAFRKVKDDAKVVEAVQAAIQRIVKATRGKTPIPGVSIVERAKTVSR